MEAKSDTQKRLVKVCAYVYVFACMYVFTLSTKIIIDQFWDLKASFVLSS